jgi:hypothetical protein
MNIKACCLLSAGFALTTLAGCTSANSAQRDRTFKSYSEPDGRRHPESFDVNANGVVTCTAASGQSGDFGCTVRDPSGFPKNIKKGDSLTVSAAGKATLVCMGVGALHCEADVKD